MLKPGNMFHAQGPSLLELARQALSSTDRGYDLLAPKFDYTPFRTPEAVLERTFSTLIAAYGEEVLVGKRALDVCCGTGAVFQALLRYQPAACVGIDRSAGMLQQARENLEAAYPGASQSLTLLRGDALALPFDEHACVGSFDLVTCFGAFGHVVPRDEPRLLREVYKALRPGGRFVFATTGPAPLLAPNRWLGTAFNLTMRLRNALWKPEFVMYYFTFLLPRATQLLREAGFAVRIFRGAYDPPFRRLVLVEARRPHPA